VLYKRVDKPNLSFDAFTYKDESKFNHMGQMEVVSQKTFKTPMGELGQVKLNVAAVGYHFSLSK
jgi:hypothetical protein